MQLLKILQVWAVFALCAVTCPGQEPSAAVVVNRNEAKWTHSPKDPTGAESTVLREDPASGGLELLVRYPSGHVFAPHWHESNERIILLEGRISLRQGDTEKFLEAGGFAFLPSREVQRLACVSKTGCTFYIAWDGKPTSHPAATR